MKKILTLTTLFAALLTLVGCEKTEDDTPDGMIEIFAESMNGGSKVILDGLNATWRSGDEIRINGSTATVERRGDRAYISDASISEGTNRALYPASLSTVNWGTDNPTITFPAYYHYRTDGAGHQVLDLPMAAYSTGSTPLQFKHLTGALYITVKNTSANPRTIQSVTVKSNTYALNGSVTVAMNTADLISARTGMLSERVVTLVFDEVVALATNASVQVMIPILPVRSDNKFTIEVKSYEEGQSTSYLSSKSQTSEVDHSLARNQLGYAPMNIPVGETTTPVLTYTGAQYEIRTANDFVKMTEAINNQWYSNTANYKLMNDIDMVGHVITPITYAGFNGVINGDGHVVKNLTINSILLNNDTYRCALFCTGSPGAEVKNIQFDELTLNHTVSTTNSIFMGCIFGYYENSSNAVTVSINNCLVRYRMINVQGANGEVRIGGLVGDIEGAHAGLNISESYVEMPNITINGNTIYFGGLVGYNGNANASISQSYWIGNEISLNATNNVLAGGLMGFKGNAPLFASNIKVQGRIVASSVSGAKRFVGALVGEYSRNDLANITNDTISNFSASMNGVKISPIGYWGTNLAN